MSDHVSIQEAAALLGLPKSLVVRRIFDGRLRFTVIDGEKRCLREDVLALKDAEAAAKKADI
jgi:excisionase family DNA binding protein